MTLVLALQLTIIWTNASSGRFFFTFSIKFRFTLIQSWSTAVGSLCAVRNAYWVFHFQCASISRTPCRNSNLCASSSRDFRAFFVTLSTLRCSSSHARLLETFSTVVIYPRAPTVTVRSFRVFTELATGDELELDSAGRFFVSCAKLAVLSCRNRSFCCVSYGKSVH
jgi:hypothetical protein